MTSGSDTAIDDRVVDAIASAASAAGLVLDGAFTDADLPTAAGPFVTMNLMGADGTTITACVAVRDNLTTSDETLQSLALAAAQALGTSGDPAPAGPIGTGADLSLRFSMPVSAMALTDGAELQALVVAASDRRGDLAGAAPDGAADAARRAMADGGADVGNALRALGSPTTGLDKLVNVSLDVSVELGRTSVTLAEVMDYDVGSVIELDRAAGAPVDVRVNGTLLAQGEVVLIDDEYAVRITAIHDPHQDR